MDDQITPVNTSSFTQQYPALLSEVDVIALARLSCRMPKGATVVEIGSKIGGSAMIICEHVPDLGMLHLIDSAWNQVAPCVDDAWIATMKDRIGDVASLTMFECAQRFLSRWHKNIQFHKMTSPYDMTWWSEPIDLIFEDSSHRNPQLHDNLEFWYHHLRSGGIFAGHDFDLRWPDVIQEVLWFAESKKITVQILGSIWWFEKP